MTITCTTIDDFFKSIARLVEHGLGFHADHDTLTITLTGAY